MTEREKLKKRFQDITDSPDKSWLQMAELYKELSRDAIRILDITYEVLADTRFVLEEVKENKEKT